MAAADGRTPKGSAMAGQSGEALGRAREAHGSADERARNRRSFLVEISPAMRYEEFGLLGRSFHRLPFGVADRGALVPYLLNLNWDAYLHALSEPGRVIQFENDRATLKVVAASDLRLSSGRLSVLQPWYRRDPDVDSDMIFATLAPGTYRVEVITAVFETERGPISRGAAVRLRTGDGTAKSWSAALGDSLDTAAGFDVDGGVGLLMDADQLGRTSGPDLIAMTRPLNDERVSVSLPSTGPADVVAFACGMGDGVYAVLLGHDAAGTVTEVLVDLELCAWSPEWAEFSDQPPAD